MNIVVCIRQGRDGEINPFDACAYEAALGIKGAQITLLSMGVPSTEQFLLNLTRLGASNAVLLTDRAFAGADTIATAYALSLAVKRLSPDLIICGRQTLEGDTAQTAPMLSVYAQTSLITNVMKISSVSESSINCLTRTEGEQSAEFPALITIERVNHLRLPGLRSKLGSVSVWNASDVGADLSRCGLAGSPTRVLETHENQSGRRKCTFISPNQLKWAIEQGLKKNNISDFSSESNEKKLKNVMIIGESPREMAQTVSDDISVISLSDAQTITDIIKIKKPSAVIWESDAASKRIAAQVAAKLNLGLCADCTCLETDGNQLFMIRPALSGSVIAKIKSLTIPAMATVRTAQTDNSDIFIAAGFGTAEKVDDVKKFAKRLNAELVSTRKAVDRGLYPYEMQVGLTGKTVSPPVYITIGVSGAVHHIVGMSRSGTVISINPDRNAPVFDYSDYGIVASIDEVICEN